MVRNNNVCKASEEESRGRERGTRQHLGSHLLEGLVLSWRVSRNQVVSVLEGCKESEPLQVRGISPMTA